MPVLFKESDFVSFKCVKNVSGKRVKAIFTNVNKLSGEVQERVLMPNGRLSTVTMLTEKQLDQRIRNISAGSGLPDESEKAKVEFAKFRQVNPSPV